MKRVLSFIISSIISVHFCHAQRELKMEDMKDYLPKETSKFTLVNQLFELKDTSVITPNAVYVFELEEQERRNNQVVRSKKSYTFIRFFNDGRAFVSFPYLNYPSVEEFNDLTYGRPSFYTIKNGEIIVEIYMDKIWGVMSMVARPVANGIEFYLLSGTPNVKLKEKDKDQKSDMKTGRNFFYNKDSSNSFYRKDHTRLYNWPR